MLDVLIIAGAMLAGYVLGETLKRRGRRARIRERARVALG